jgi:hypothetical protein
VKDINQDIFLPPVVVEMLRRARDIRERFRQTGEDFTQEDYRAAVHAATQDLQEGLQAALVDWAAKEEGEQDGESDMMEMHLPPIAVEFLRIARELRKEMKKGE